MKKIVYILFPMLLLTIMLGFPSCSEDKKEWIFEVSPASLNFDSEGGTQTIYITSNGYWGHDFANGGELQYKQSNGDGNGTIELTVNHNLSTTSRTWTKELYQYDSEKKVRVTITQAGANSSGNNTTISTPTGLNATNDGNQVYITWNSVSGASSYKVYRSSSSSGSYSSIGAATTTYKYDSSPLAGYNYYKVTAVGSSGAESSMSSYVSCNYTSGSGGGNTETKPNAPTGVSARQNGTSITVSWNSVSSATSYKIYRSNSLSGTYSQLGNSSSLNYTDYSPLNGYNYYKITAINSVGESSQSSSISYNFSSGGGSTNNAPCLVSNSSVSGTSSITLSWSAATGTSCGTPTSYKIYKRNPNTSIFELKTTTSSRSYTESSSTVHLWYK